MVMEEMPEPRPTHVLERGLYNKPGEQVEAGVPEGYSALFQKVNLSIGWDWQNGS